jgi:hypothetical protein
MTGIEALTRMAQRFQQHLAENPQLREKLLKGKPKTTPKP